ncbi:hypothetical protein NDU88_005025 [Pleurodeles waltl]|uniref:Uncharacterized protein n=1 Tax=Pleurodeles waltl TaxID=8319 RepID=A0AAV7RHD5_PLEWA|nr:hypothetical protein NDU88_005025 [Pleurodeles waltl]
MRPSRTSVITAALKASDERLSMTRPAPPPLMGHVTGLLEPVLLDSEGPSGGEDDAKLIKTNWNDNIAKL